MKFELKKSVVLCALAAATTVPALTANAGATITFGEDNYLSAGFGFRAGYSSVDDAAPDGGRTNDLSLDNSRIYLSGSLNKYIKGMLNTQNDDTSGMKTMDANVQLAVIPEMTIWLGRFLSPSDRANMAGPYFTLGGGYWSTVASRYGANEGYIGRDDGVAVEGSLADKKFQYAFGVFEGKTLGFNTGTLSVATPQTTPLNTTKPGDDLMYAGRLQYDFWDALPGYYAYSGNYLGSKDILSIGIAGRFKSDAVLSPTAKGDYTSWSIDFLMEKKDVGPGAVSVEAAYYDYDTDGVIKAEQGQAYSAGLGYIFKEPVGWGQFQPFVRYQKFDADAKSTAKTQKVIEQYDIGTAYIIDGYNAQISAFYSNAETVTNATTGATKDVDSINIQTQFQF